MKKIVLITGGSRGLGRDMALQMAAHGHDVIITYNTQKDSAEEVIDELKAKGARAASLQLSFESVKGLDVFVQQLRATLEKEFGTECIDFLVNNAGMGATIPFMSATEEEFDQFMNVHFKGVFFLTQKLIPMMNDHGRIINISSGTTRFCNPGYSIYASMKSAIETLTRYIAKEVGHRGITANVLAPGPIETDFNNAAIRSNPQLKERLTMMTALGRVGTPEDIGGVVALLCAPEAQWVNGQRIEASGGINL